MDELKNRKTTRLKGADYNRNQAVFLTICTKERRCVLSRIVGTVEDAGHRRTVEDAGPYNARGDTLSLFRAYREKHGLIPIIVRTFQPSGLSFF